jgi:hypothetical protein
MRLCGARRAWEAEVDCALTIVNRTRLPIEGTMRFVDLPEGWTALGEARLVEKIMPNSSRRLTLMARATALPSGSGGSVSLPVEFTTKDGEVHRCVARASCFTAVPVAAGIQIDGDLSDWPPGAVNVASDFRTISQQRIDAPGNDAGKPHNATMFFVARDRDYLYAAINCESDAAADQSSYRRNTVVYDDMIPVGDELVELLIDPLNTGTRSPADLYHIAVKPSGTYLTEKGVRFDPPCGRREAWPADIDVAARAVPDRWTAELRIPFESLGDSAAEHVIWGINITRYDAPRQEFSTWSGAVGNAYDPLSLGNVYIP